MKLIKRTKKMSGISEYKFCQFKLFQWTTLCIRVVFYSRSKCPWNSFHSLKPCQCSFFFKPSDKSTFNIMLSCLDFLSLLQVMKIMAKCWYFLSNWRETCTNKSHREITENSWNAKNNPVSVDLHFYYSICLPEIQSW